MLKKMICVAVVLGLASSASALVIDTDVVWDEQTAIHEQEGGGVEITATGKLTADARVDIDSPGWLIIRGGGQVFFNNTFKFPDNDEGPPGPTIHIETGGYMESADTESIGDRLYDGGLFLDVGAIFKTGNIGEGDRRDPRSDEWRIYPWGAAGAFDITVEGDWAIVPEPATMMLLGLGSLFRLRRRK